MQSFFVILSHLTITEKSFGNFSLSFGIGMYLKPEFASHVPDLGIKLSLLLTTGLIPAGILAFVLNAILPKE